MGLGRAEFVHQQQVVHRIAPAHARQETEVPPGERRKPALRLHLAETGIVRSDDDVAGQHHLDADGVGDALDSRDDGLPAHLRKLEHVHVALGRLGRLRARTEELRHIESRGEVPAFGTEHAHPQVGIPVEQRERLRHLLGHFRDERVPARDVIDHDLEGVTNALAVDAPGRGFFRHCEYSIGHG